MKYRMLTFCVVALVLALAPGMATADDFADYKTANGTTGVVNLPTVAAGWFVAVDYFPDGTAAVVDGQFEAEGRMIAANNNKIYLQRTYGSSQWDVVATVSGTMDPSFIHVSPDGSKIALGPGYGQPLYIVPTSVLSAQSPPNLTNLASVKKFPLISYYDGDWADNRYFVINGGQWPSGCEEPYDDNPACTFVSGVGSVDTNAGNPATHVGRTTITNIPGASGDVDVDSNGNLLTGLGWATGPPNRTGEIKVWQSTEWNPAAASNLNYNNNNKIVAENLLSVAYLGEDAEGNFHVGGGDAFGTGGTSENGYAAIIRHGVVNQIALGNRSIPVNDGNKTSNGEYKFFAPDPCQDDSATGILAGDWGRGLAVMWNPTYRETHGGTCYGDPGSASDYWNPGVTPRLTVYYPGSAPDSDGDGIPDTSDNAYLTPNANQRDTDGDGYGNAVDADFNNDNEVNYNDYNELSSNWGTSNPNSQLDMNSDGDLNYEDYNLFSQQWTTSAPWY